MKKLLCVALAATILATAVQLFARQTVQAATPDFLEFEATLKGSSTDNVSKNFRRGYDKFGTTGFTARAYMGPLAEFTFTGEYTWYHSQVNLSNFYYSVGVRFIPTSESSRTSLMFSANISERSYRRLNEGDGTTGDASVSNASQFTSADSRLTASIGQRITDRLSARAGYDLSITGYDVAEVNDRYDHGVFAGLNISLPYQTALDVEAGYQFEDFKFVPDTASRFGFPYYAIQSDDVYNILSDGKLKYWSISPRLSKSITSRTGISLTVSHRSFIDRDDSALVYGNSAIRTVQNTVEGIISPWAGVYEGEYYKLSVKSHDLSPVVISASFGYWDKKFLTTLEPLQFDSASGEWIPVPIISTRFVRDGGGDRTDSMRRYNLTVLLPLNRHTYYLEPALKVDYTDNSSTIVVYNYDDLSVTMELRVRF